MRKHLLWMLAVFVGCAGSSAPVNSDGMAVVDSKGGADLVAEVASDLAQPDLVEPVDLFEMKFVDQSTPDLGPLCAPGEGCFLDECDENSDCLSGWCVEHLGDGVCTQSCQEECPPGWSCKLLSGADIDPVYLCFSNVGNLCKPCGDSGDCTGSAGTETACVQYGEEGSFCGATCAVDEDCPWGFSCLTTVTVDGVSTLQCAADAGVCPCTDTSVALGLWTPCERENEFGICTGQRVCLEEGLSDCDAAIPAAESCNGVDDNCDGDVDEGFFIEGQYVGLCDDGNDCTTDLCKGEEGCVQEELSEGECIDGDACTVGDHCEAGVCAGSPVACDDSNPCTDDVCDGFGGCKFTDNAAQCDDGDPCTVGDICAAGGCAGTPVACDCQANADCEQFEDGDLCNGTLGCNKEKWPYQCIVIPETVVECAAPEGIDAICQQAVCEPTTGVCGFAPDHGGFACSDGDACTIGDSCEAGSCVAGVAASCADNNICTDDSCDATLGCVHDNNEAPCQDGDVCTVGDFCVAGVCSPGAAAVCADSNPCTADSCDSDLGCQFVATEAECDDGNGCTLVDVCVAGVCKGGTAPDCDDDNLCTTDSCDPAVGCIHLLNSVPCDDGDVCTTGDHCHLGDCVSSGNLECKDSNLCTTDSCSPLAGCQFVDNNVACDDANACTVDDACGDGMCTAGLPLDCDDNDLCTDDSCDSAQGCVHVNNSVPCDDHDACTVSEFCSGGLCGGGAGVECDDQELCTTDSCHPIDGCVNTPNAEVCDDGDACTDGDVCGGGTCQPGAALVCEDANVCTDDSCDPGAGCLYTPVANGIACAPDMQCWGGECIDACESGSLNFEYTGGVQDWTVPACVKFVTVELFGAAGGGNDLNNPEGGRGGKATGKLAVTPGQVLHVYVGGSGASGGWNGGGKNVTAWAKGWGGGASDIRVGGTAFSDRKIVAGGGGGHPAYSLGHGGWQGAEGGAGGGTSGQDGNPSDGNNPPAQGGKGGTQAGGGAAGATGLDCCSFVPGTAGSLGQGGKGAGETDNDSCGSAGSGGGGYYGGGGGGHHNCGGGGGGGGSSYVGGVTESSTAADVRSGHGQVKITY
jgi:hypothetical protein